MKEKSTVIVAELMKSQKMTMATMARRLGLTRQRINNLKTQETIRVDLLVKMLEEMDYKLVAMPCSHVVGKDEWEVSQ